MKIKKTILLSGIIGTVLTGCVSMTPTVRTDKAYVIYDIKSESSPTILSNAIINGFKSQTSAVSAQQDIPPYPLPEKPGRFELVQPELKGNFAALVGQLPKQFKCKGNILTIKAANTGMSTYGERTSFDACLLPYKGGYHLDIYTTFTTKEGGFSAKSLGAALAKSVVGDSGQFIPKTINSVVSELEKNNAKVVLVDSYPST